jgi:hypothetical protein
MKDQRKRGKEKRIFIFRQYLLIIANLEKVCFE